MSCRAGFVLFLLALAGCAAKTLTLSGFNSGESSIMKVGAHFDVALPANPTTGFHWQLAEADPGVVVVGEPFFTPRGDALGVAGTETFHCIVTGEGQTRIVLVYRRPWEEGVRPLRVWYLGLEGVR